MNPLEQLRIYRGDLETGADLDAAEIIRWAHSARPFCPRCQAEPLFELQGTGLSGRTRSRALVETMQARGVVRSPRPVHCDACPTADPILQLEVLRLLAALPLGEAWCVRYARAMPLGPAQRLDPEVEAWLLASAPCWTWGVPAWTLALRAGGAAVQPRLDTLEVRLPDRRTVIAWSPGRAADLERSGRLSDTLIDALCDINHAVHGLLAVDLASNTHQLQASRLGYAALGSRAL